MIALTFAQLVEEIGKRFPVGKSTETSQSVTGEPYVVIGAQKNGVPKIAGTRDEGAAGEWAYDEETACMQAATCFETYAEGRSGVLYWRTEPILDWDKGRCIVYMRCLISDKPELPWVIEVESGINWSTVCCCGSEDEAEERARYFRPMSCFSGRTLRIRRK